MDIKSNEILKSFEGRILEMMYIPVQNILSHPVTCSFLRLTLRSMKLIYIFISFRIENTRFLYFKNETMLFRDILVAPCLFVCYWHDSPQWARASSFTRFLDHTQRRTTVGRTLIYVESSQQRN